MDYRRCSIYLYQDCLVMSPLRTGETARSSIYLNAVKMTNCLCKSIKTMSAMPFCLSNCIVLLQFFKECAPRLLLSILSTILVQVWRAKLVLPNNICQVSAKMTLFSMEDPLDKIHCHLIFILIEYLFSILTERVLVVLCIESTFGQKDRQRKYPTDSVLICFDSAKQASEKRPYRWRQPD